jgi:hypothetical protein
MVEEDSGERLEKPEVLAPLAVQRWHDLLQVGDAPHEEVPLLRSERVRCEVCAHTVGHVGVDPLQVDAGDLASSASGGERSCEMPLP